MSEKFTASNGVKVWLTGDGVVCTESVGQSGGNTQALREFFQWERDRELGRWRDPADPFRVVYQELQIGEVRHVCVVDELSGYSEVVDEETAKRNPMTTESDVAARFFAAHPAPRDLPTAIGTIIGGNGCRILYVGPDHYERQYPDLAKELWLEIESGCWRTEAEVLETVGPDWVVIHEGMKIDE